MRTPFPALLLACAIAALPSCGSTDASDETPAPGETDGRYHPAASGVHTTEDAACTTLANAHEHLLTTLACAGTARKCPDLLRAEFSTACLEYDQGSVEGCVAYWNKQATCADLNASIGNCVVTAYTGTEPKGCP